MILCNLPIPKKLQELLERAMKEFTEEIKENNVNIETSKVNIITKEGE